jgi:hypothetical protein
MSNVGGGFRRIFPIQKLTVTIKCETTVDHVLI